LPRIAAHRTKIAGPKVRGHIGLPIRHELHAKARESHVIAHHFRIDAGLVEFEHCRAVDDLPRLAVDDLIEAHRFRETSADMKELQAKRQAGVGPEGMVRAEAQRLVLIVTELRHGRRQRILGGLIGIARELSGLTLEPGIVEGLAGGRARRRGRGNLRSGPLSGRQHHG
jgi:hypothetical protein